SNAHDNLIGGTTSGAGNIIAYSKAIPSSSSGAGVLVWHIDGGVPVYSNAILGNSIFGNARLGIDLVNAQGAWGVTPNDTGDADTGANNLQNFPVLQSATTGGGVVKVRGTLNSTPRKTFRIEFF